MLPRRTAGSLSGFGAALFAALWAYSGWQFLPMAASEVQNPERNLPRAIVGGTLLVLGIYLLVNVAYLYALPFWEVATSNSTAYPDAPSVAAKAVQTFAGAKAAPIAALIFLVSSIGALNGTILARARVPYAAARDGLFFESFGRLNPRSRVPVFSIIVVSIWAALLAASGTFDQLTNMAVLSYAIFWMPVVLAVIVLQRQASGRATPLPGLGLPVCSAGLRARHGVDRGQRIDHSPGRVRRHDCVDTARTAGVSAVQAPASERLEVPDGKRRAPAQPEPAARLAKVTLQPRAIPLRAA